MSTSPGFILHIGGEATKRHTIPVDMLIDIAKNLQELVVKLAQYDLPSTETIDLSNFKIELSKFQAGSATPTFIFTSNINVSPINSIDNQRDKVHEKFNHIMSLANTGNYLKLRDEYQEPFRRNEIVTSVFSFVKSFRNAPVEILDKNHKPIYTIKKFKDSVKDALITEITDGTSVDKEKTTQIARVRVVRDKGKNKILRKDVLELFDSKIRADYSTDTIVAGNTVYELHFNLTCKVDTINENFQIESDMLGIFGIGANLDEAEKSFAEEFDYIYNRYNELSDKKLTKDVQRIKTMLNSIVKNISK